MGMVIRSAVHHEPDVHSTKTERFELIEINILALGMFRRVEDEEWILSLVNSVYAVSLLEPFYVFFSCTDDMLRTAGSETSGILWLQTELLKIF
jgi:hypothetical protein